MSAKYRKSIRLNGRLYSQRFTRKADAEKWYGSMLRQKEMARAGLELPVEPIAIERFCADFILSRTHLGTNDLDETRIRLYVLPAFGPLIDAAGRVVRPGRDLHLITRKEWRQWLDSLITVHGLSEKTHNNIRALVHRLYEVALQDEPPRATMNPIASIKPRRGGDKEIEFFERREDIHRYLEALEEIDASAWIAGMIALNTGMREGEIAALNESDVSLVNRSIRVNKTWSHSRRKVLLRTKTRDERSIGINSSLASAIAHYRQLRGKRPDDAPFCSLPDGRRMPGDSILTRHKAACRKAGLKPLTFHATRHTFATHFLAAGGSVWDLRNILGHKSVTTTERYAHRLKAMTEGRAGVFQVQTPSLAEEEC